MSDGLSFDVSGGVDKKLLDGLRKLSELLLKLQKAAGSRKALSFSGLQSSVNILTSEFPQLINITNSLEAHINDLSKADKPLQDMANRLGDFIKKSHIGEIASAVEVTIEKLEKRGTKGSAFDNFSNSVENLTGEIKLLKAESDSIKFPEPDSSAITKHKEFADALGQWTTTIMSSKGINTTKESVKQLKEIIASMDFSTVVSDAKGDLDLLDSLFDSIIETLDISNAGKVGTTSSAIQKELKEVQTQLHQSADVLENAGERFKEVAQKSVRIGDFKIETDTSLDPTALYNLAEEFAPQVKKAIQTLIDDILGAAQLDNKEKLKVIEHQINQFLQAINNNDIDDADSRWRGFFQTVKEGAADDLMGIVEIFIQLEKNIQIINKGLEAGTEAKKSFKNFLEEHEKLIKQQESSAKAAREAAELDKKEWDTGDHKKTIGSISEMLQELKKVAESSGGVLQDEIKILEHLFKRLEKIGDVKSAEELYDQIEKLRVQFNSFHKTVVAFADVGINTQFEDAAQATQNFVKKLQEVKDDLGVKIDLKRLSAEEQKQYIESVKNVAKSAGLTAASELEKIMEDSDIGEVISKPIKESVKSTATTVKKSGVILRKANQETKKEVKDTAKEIESITEAATQEMSEDFKDVKETAIRSFDEIQDSAVSDIGKIRDTASEIVESIKEAFTSIPIFFKEIFSSDALFESSAKKIIKVQEEVDKALQGSATVAEEVSKRERIAFKESADVFQYLAEIIISGSDKLNKAITGITLNIGKDVKDSVNGISDAIDEEVKEIQGKVDTAVKGSKKVVTGAVQVVGGGDDDDISKNRRLDIHDEAKAFFDTRLGDTIDAWKAANRHSENLAKAVTKTAIVITEKFGDEAWQDKEGGRAARQSPQAFIEDVDYNELIDLIYKRSALSIKKDFLVPLTEEGEKFLGVTAEQGEALRKEYVGMIKQKKLLATWQDKINALIEKGHGETAKRIQKVAKSYGSETPAMFDVYKKAIENADKLAAKGDNIAGGMKQIKMQIDGMVNKSVSLFEKLYKGFENISDNATGLKSAFTLITNAKDAAWNDNSLKQYQKELINADKGMVKLIRTAIDLKESGEDIGKGTVEGLKQFRKGQLAAIKEAMSAGEIEMKGDNIKIVSPEFFKRSKVMTEELAIKLGILHTKYNGIVHSQEEWTKGIAKINDKEIREIVEGVREIGDESSDTAGELGLIVKAAKTVRTGMSTELRAVREELAKTKTQISDFGAVEASGGKVDLSQMNQLKIVRQELTDQIAVLTDKEEKLVRTRENVSDSIKKQKEQVEEIGNSYEDMIGKLSAGDKQHAASLRELNQQYGSNAKLLGAHSKAINDAEKSIDSWIAVNKRKIEQTENNIESQKLLLAAMKGTQKERNDVQTSIEKNQKALDKMNAKMREAKKETILLKEASLSWKKSIGAMGNETSEFNKKLNTGKKHIDQYERSMSGLLKRTKKFAMFAIATMAVRGLARGIMEAVQIMTDYDQGLHNIQAVTEATNTQMRLMGTIIRQVATDTKFSASEVAEGITVLGQAGLSSSESIQVVNDVAKLATGTMTDFDDVTDLMTSSLNAFNIEASRAGEISDVMANAVNNSKLDIDKLRTAFNYIGAAGYQLGLSLNDVIGSMMSMADQGIRASTIGTGLRRVLTRLIAPNHKLAVSMKENGLELKDLNPKLVGYEKVLENLTKMTWDYSTGTVDMAKAVGFFGVRGAQATAALIKGYKSGDVSAAIAQTKEMGSAAEMAGIQQEGLGLKIKNMQDRMANVVLALGDAGFTGALKLGVDGMRELSKATADYINTDGGELVSQVLMLGTAFGTTTGLMWGAKQLIDKMKKKIAFIPKGDFDVALYNQMVLKKYMDKNISGMYEQTTAWEKFQKTWKKKIIGIGKLAGIGVVLAALAVVTKEVVMHFDQLFKKLMDSSQALADQRMLLEQWGDTFKNVLEGSEFDEWGNASKKMFDSLISEGAEGEKVLKTIAAAMNISTSELKNYVASSQSLEEARYRLQRIQEEMQKIVDTKLEKQITVIGKAFEAATKQRNMDSLLGGLSGISSGLLEGISTNVNESMQSMANALDSVTGWISNLTPGSKLLHEWSTSQLEAIDALSKAVIEKVKGVGGSYEEGMAEVERIIAAKEKEGILDPPDLKHFADQMRTNMTEAMVNAFESWNMDSVVNSIRGSVDKALTKAINVKSLNNMGFADKAKAFATGLGKYWYLMFNPLTIMSGLTLAIDEIDDQLKKLVPERTEKQLKLIDEGIKAAVAKSVEMKEGSNALTERVVEFFTIHADELEFDSSMIDKLSKSVIQSMRGGTDSLVKGVNHIFLTSKKEMDQYGRDFNTFFEQWINSNAEARSKWEEDVAKDLISSLGLDASVVDVVKALKEQFKVMQQMKENGKKVTVGIKKFLFDLEGITEKQVTKLNNIFNDALEGDYSKKNEGKLRKALEHELLQVNMSAEQRKKELDQIMKNYVDSFTVGKKEVAKLGKNIQGLNILTDASKRLKESFGEEASFNLDITDVSKKLKEIEDDADKLRAWFKTSAVSLDFMQVNGQAKQDMITGLTDIVTSREKDLAVIEASGQSEKKIMAAKIKAQEKYKAAMSDLIVQVQIFGQLNEKETTSLIAFGKAIDNEVTDAVKGLKHELKVLSGFFVELEGRYDNQVTGIKRFYQARAAAAQTASDTEAAILSKSYVDELSNIKDQAEEIKDIKWKSLDAHLKLVEDNHNNELKLKKKYLVDTIALADASKNRAIKNAKEEYAIRKRLADKEFAERTKGISSSDKGTAWSDAESKYNSRVIESAKATTQAKIDALTKWRDHLFTTYNEVGSVPEQFAATLSKAQDDITQIYDDQIAEIKKWKEALDENYDEAGKDTKEYKKVAQELNKALIDAKQSEVDTLIDWKNNVKKTHVDAIKSLKDYKDQIRAVQAEIKQINKDAAEAVINQNKAQADINKRLRQVEMTDGAKMKDNYQDVQKRAKELENQMAVTTDSAQMDKLISEWQSLHGTMGDIAVSAREAEKAMREARKEWAKATPEEREDMDNPNTLRPGIASTQAQNATKAMNKKILEAIENRRILLEAEKKAELEVIEAIQKRITEAANAMVNAIDEVGKHIEKLLTKLNDTKAFKLVDGKDGNKDIELIKKGIEELDKELDKDHEFKVAFKMNKDELSGIIKEEDGGGGTFIIHPKFAENATEEIDQQLQSEMYTVHLTPEIAKQTESFSDLLYEEGVQIAVTPNIDEETMKAQLARLETDKGIIFNIAFTEIGSETLPISEKIDAITAKIHGMSDEEPTKINFDLSAMSDEELNIWMDATAQSVYDKVNGYETPEDAVGLKIPLTEPTDEEFEEFALASFNRVNGYEPEKGTAGLKIPLTEPTDEELDEAVANIYASINAIKSEDKQGFKILPILDTESDTFVKAFDAFKVLLGDTHEVLINFMATGSSTKPFTEKIAEFIKVIKNLYIELNSLTKTIVIPITTNASTILDQLKAIQRLVIPNKTFTVTKKEKVVSEHAEGGSAGGENFPRRQGMIPGHGTKDDVNAKLMRGEYIIKQDAVDFYGQGFMDLLNNKLLPQGVPQFATGGLIGGLEDSAVQWLTDALTNMNSYTTDFSDKNASISDWFNSFQFTNTTAQKGIDSIASLMTPGEYVIQEPIVNQFGKSFFDKLNNGVLQFANGGLVGTSKTSTSDNAQKISEVKNLGRIELAIGSSAYPLVGNKDVIEELKIAINREGLIRST